MKLISTKRARRKGAIAVLFLFLLIVLLAMIAFAVDIGYITLVRTELQSAADSSALAAASGYFEDPNQARAYAKSYAEMHRAAGDNIDLVTNEDVQLGVWNETARTFSVLPPGGEVGANAIRVTTRVDASRGNSAQLFFAPLLGTYESNVSASAIAMASNKFRGFEPPSDGGNQPILPFVLDLQTWNDMQGGIGPDNWRWDEQLGQVVSGPDGILEMNLLPEGNNAPGNRGYVEIGPSGGNNGTLAQQIRNGIKPSEFQHHGGSLKFGDDGTLVLGGRPGTISSLSGDFQSVVGETRIIPLFSQVSGSGNNTSYTLVKWIAVRIMYVNYQGNPKKVLVQAAGISISGGVPASGSDGETSKDIYSMPRLVQ